MKPIAFSEEIRFATVYRRNRARLRRINSRLQRCEASRFRSKASAFCVFHLVLFVESISDLILKAFAHNVNSEVNEPSNRASIEMTDNVLGMTNFPKLKSSPELRDKLNRFINQSGKRATFAEAKSAKNCSRCSNYERYK